jgi:hypothetical protein
MAQLPFPTTPDSVAQQCIAITPADSDLAAQVRALYIGGSGDVKITDPQGNAVTFANAQAGSILPVMAKRVWSTGTSATNIIGLV